MTTICTDGALLAADGLITDRGTIVAWDCVKIARLNDGRLIGLAGSPWMLGVAAAFFNDEAEKPNIEDQLEGLMLCEDGACFYFGRNLVLHPMRPPLAAGSGMDFALATLDAGGSVAAAVSAAIHRDVSSGGNIIVMAPGVEPAPAPVGHQPV